MSEIENLEAVIAKLLRAGVLLAGALLATGWFLQVIGGTGLSLGQLSSYASEPLFASTSRAWVEGNFAVLLAYAGLALLICLPVIRVALTAILFLKNGEKLLAFIAGIVFAALLASFALGIEL